MSSAIIPPMDLMQLLVDLHQNNHRLGPGSEDVTVQAMQLAGLDPQVELTIADVGCGTGASTLSLARELNAKITAIDLFPAFLSKLEERASEAGVSEKIRTQPCSMDDLPFANESLDVIWSEGAIYNIGFENGVNLWKRFIKAGGMLVASEIIWTTEERPAEVESHWNKEYPEISTASEKIAVLEKAGYRPKGFFTLAPYSWLDNYYSPLQKSHAAFLQRHGDLELAREIVGNDLQEIALYRRYADYYSYGMFIAEKI